jgi:hypothetical protein
VVLEAFEGALAPIDPAPINDLSGYRAIGEPRRLPVIRQSASLARGPSRAGDRFNFFGRGCGGTAFFIKERGSVLGLSRYCRVTVTLPVTLGLLTGSGLRALGRSGVVTLLHSFERQDDALDRRPGFVHLSGERGEAHDALVQ